jgi:hypothetical protein
MSTLGNGKHTPYPGADGTLAGALAEVDALLAALVAQDRGRGSADRALVSPATLVRDLEAWLDAADAQRTAEDGVA